MKYHLKIFTDTKPLVGDETCLIYCQEVPHCGGYFKDQAEGLVEVMKELKLMKAKSEHDLEYLGRNKRFLPSGEVEMNIE